MMRVFTLDRGGMLAKRKLPKMLSITLALAAVLSVCAFLLLSPQKAVAQDGGNYSLDAPEVILKDIPFSVDVEGEGSGATELVVDGENYEVDLSGGSATVDDVTVSQTGEVTLALVQGGEEVFEQSELSVFGWVSILPPVLAIAVALIFRQVVPALFAGIYIGAIVTYGFSLGGFWYALFDILQVYVLEAVTDSGHATIMLFTFMIGGMVGIISRNGGTRGVANRIVSLASNPSRGQTATGALGVAIFFDDYANTLVVGNTMRSVTDRLRISREKLAYLVDSTAAPIATIAIISTWVGFQVGLIDDAVGGIEGFGQSGYSIFLNSLPYAFYPILALVLVFTIALTGRDFGPMRKAEERARLEGKVMREGAEVDPAAAEGGELEPKEGVPARALNAVIPVVVLIGVTMVGLYITGEGETFQDVIGSADSYAALTWASLLSVLVAAALSLGQRILSLGEVVNSWYSGVKAMLFGIIILILAWSLSGVIGVLGTGDYLVSILSESLLPAVLPALIFVLAAATAFATGTSWGTMGILFPLTVPLTWAVLQTNGMDNPDGYYVMYASVSTVLAGAVWGDHCSPISDTTVLSSIGSGCDHIDHVRTQIPYALLAGIVAVVLGLLPAGFGVPWWILLPVTIAVVVAVVLFFGKSVREEAETEAREEAKSLT